MMLPDFKQTARQSGSIRRMTGFNPLTGRLALQISPPGSQFCVFFCQEKPRLVPTQGAAVSKRAAE